MAAYTQDQTTQVGDQSSKGIALQNEYKQVKDMAKQRQEHKNERKMYRPQTGVTYFGKHGIRNASTNQLDRSVRTQPQA